jgi:dTDP-4-dehydrorhamnose reductase
VAPPPPDGPRRALVTGAAGRVGRAVAAELARRGWTVDAADHHDLDITDRSAVDARIDRLGPHLVVNAAAWTDVDACEHDEARARLVNGDAVAGLAAAARRAGAHLCHLSTDHVFGDSGTGPHDEAAEPTPRSAYARSKRVGEEAALAAGATVARTAWLSGATGPSAVAAALHQARTSAPARWVADEWGSPTTVDALVGALVPLAELGPGGVFHVAGEGRATWCDLARLVFREAGADPDRVVPATGAEVRPPGAAPRPGDASLTGSALRLQGLSPPPSWEPAVARLVGEILRSAGPTTAPH